MTDPTDPGGAGHEFSTPQEAAAALDVSPSGLRRLADIYAGVCGELPRDPRTHSRIWPREAVAELATARSLVAEKRTPTIRAALQAIRRGEVGLRPDLAVRRLNSAARAAGVVAASPGAGVDPALHQSAREAAQDAAHEAALEAARQIVAEARLEARRNLAELADIARGLGEELIQARGELGSLRSALSGAMTEIAALRAELAAAANDSRQARSLDRRDSPGERGAHPSRDTEQGVGLEELRELRRRLRYLETEIEIRGL
jgi:vacuolar-type H+-ATPase subunit H